MRNLTRRELQIAALVFKGSTNHQIATTLSISVSTVKVHVKSILKTLALQNRTQLAVWYWRANQLAQTLKEPQVCQLASTSAPVAKTSAEATGLTTKPSPSSIVASAPTGGRRAVS